MSTVALAQHQPDKVYDPADLHSEGILRGQLLSNLLRPLGVSLTGGRLLDLGCGYGGHAIAAARRGAEVTAVDISEHKIEVLARRVATECFPSTGSLSYQQADVAAGLPLPDAAFDTALSLGVIEWVPLNVPHGDPRCVQRDALAEVARVIKPGGAYVMGTKNRWYPNYLLHEPQMRWPLVNYMPRPAAQTYTKLMYKRDYRTYTHSLEGWRSLFLEAGFHSVEAFLPVYFYQFPLALLSTDGSRHDISTVVANAEAQVPPEYYQMAHRGRAANLRKLFLSMMTRMKLEKFFWPAFVFIARK